jgi:polyisoprenoid-binding protein YceI
MNWQIDNAHSRIQFTARHLMFSKVRGTFKEFSGTVDFNEEDPVQSVIEVIIDAASLDTGAADRDGHLRSPDFFNVAEYPQAIFRSTRIESEDGRNGRLMGNLTIKNITKEVAVEVSFLGSEKNPWGVSTAHFEGSTTIDRRDWGLTWNQALESGGVLVGDNVQIDVELELVKVPQEEAMATGD